MGVGDGCEGDRPGWEEDGGGGVGGVAFGERGGDGVSNGSKEWERGKR